jgi:hypothetical protein
MEEREKECDKYKRNGKRERGEENYADAMWKKP